MAPGRVRDRLAPVGAALTVVLLLCSVGVQWAVDARLTRSGRSDLHQLSGAGTVFLLAATSASVVGALLLTRKPGNPVGWWLAALGASVGLAGMTQAYGLLGLVADPGGHHPGAGAAAALASALFVGWLTAIAMICFLTPNGSALSARWRWAARITWTSGAVWFATILVSPVELTSPFQGVQNPIGVQGLRVPAQALRGLTGATNNVLVLASFGSLVVRFRRATGEERRQLTWLGLLALPVPLLVVAAFVAARTGHDIALNLAAGGFVAVVPVAVGLAVAKTRLYDVDRLVSRGVTYVLLSAVLLGAYGAVVLLVGEGLGGSTGGSTASVVLATLAAAALARPAHRTLQDAVDRRFSRRRYDALRLVREHVASPDPTRTVEQVLQQALGSPDLSVAYWVADRQAWVTGAGDPAPAAAQAVTVHRGGRPVARVVADDVDAGLAQAVLREAEPELDNAGLRAAVALQLAEVRASRERLAGAQLEERRRVERDLHDGAQQRLLALAAQLQAALLNGGEERMRAALATGVEQSQLVVRELRELANGLHPSVLLDGGLSAALDDLAARHDVEVHVPEPDRRYPPAVEATAWFVACEAVTNAVKHAAAARIRVEVACGGDELLVCVTDDGRGAADGDGGGLRGLADRVEAVGGRFELRSPARQGTTVRAVLPCGS